jgi:pimeloyl-ACP methyl ester carboxylesterase
MQTVTSADGTIIAYDKTGQGPAVILVAGATMTRAAWPPLAELLAPDFTVYAYDRRGRGDSTDTVPGSLAKEIQDIEAVIEAAGGSAHLYGISSGGALAIEAALQLGDKVTKLAVYEVPYDSSEAGIKRWQEYRTNLAAALAADRRGDAAALFMKLVGLPDGMIEGMRQAPMWKSMEAVAPTLVYDAEALGADNAVPTERVSALVMPTLVMDGGASVDTMPFMRPTALALTAAIPGATHTALAGQQHDVDSGVLAPVLRAFFS